MNERPELNALACYSNAVDWSGCSGLERVNATR
jgi:hypothetical protein